MTFFGVPILKRALIRLREKYHTGLEIDFIYSLICIPYSNHINLTYINLHENLRCWFLKVVSCHLLLGFILFLVIRTPTQLVVEGWRR